MRIITGLTIGLVALLAACSGDTPAAQSKDAYYLSCATHQFAIIAMLRNRIITPEQAPRHPDLVSGMTYFNIYYMPKDIREPDAMEEIRGLMDDLINSKPPKEIIAFADTCIDKTPKL